MIGALTLYQTSIGKKVIMAVTGIILYLYVIAHMLGNLKVFTGAKHFNDYAIWLREVGYPLLDHEVLLWIIRVVLLASVVLHMVAAYQVSRQDLVARPAGYARRRNIASTYASRTMRWGGVIIGLFLVYHLLHLTTGTLLAGHRGHEFAYSNVMLAFANPLATVIYLIAMIALGLHLNHGIWSVAQTLGLRTRENNGAWRGLATVSAIAIAGGFSVVPLAVLFGLVR
ncbi:MAG: succinate dehydrogenase cytochrome b subunit [Chloroflexi bacterium]|nr:succinate dehydrogenase cytochrome b subunit [Chloroflexota bacterium]